MSRAALLDAKLVLEKPTGIGQYVASLLPALAAAAPDWTIHVLRRARPWPGYGLEGTAAGNVVHHVTGERHMGIAQQWTTPRLARRLGADVVHYPHFDAPVLFPGPPVVATIHDAKYLVRPDFFPRLGRLKRAYMRGAYARTVRRAAVCLADSRATALDLERLFGAAARDVRVVPLAADPCFRPAGAAELAELRRRRGLARPYVLCVGELRPHKNHAVLVAAFARAAACADRELVLVGQRFPGGPDPEALAAEHGVAGRVRVLDDVGGDELPALYSAADAVALVSLYEGFGLPILEAMACGVPVVASRTTAAGEVAGGAGLLVDPASVDDVAAALDRALAGGEERARLVAAGAARAAELTWERTAAAVLRAWEDAAERRT